MAKENVPLISFNRGIISNLALARTDIKRTALSAAIQTNWMPRVLGSMMLRPGLGYIGASYNNAKAFHIPFIYSNSDYAALELTDQKLRIRISDAIIARVAVTTTITNGDFGAAGSWTDIDDAGATSSISGGKLSLVGTDYAAAGRRQSVTVAAGNQNKEHGLRIVVTKGNVTFRCGSTSGGDEYIAETTLGEGTHSLAFTPTGTPFYIQFTSLTQYSAEVDSCTVEDYGDVELPAPWLEADLPLIRYDQSADVVYVGCTGYQQYKIERRSTRSFSIVKFKPDTGPFRNPNLTTISLTPSALNGDITLTASRAFFKSTNVGSLFRMTSIGQKIEASFTAEDQYSDPIRITGVGASQRTFTIVRSGTFTATITLQRSVGEVGAWVDVTTYTTAATVTYNDALDNQIIFYRLGIKTGNYTSGTADVEMSYANGGLTGTVRITAYTNSTSVTAEVLESLGGTDATEDWVEGEWSSRRGYPGSVALYEGRLWWAGKGKIFGSVSDAYEDYDPETEGDAGPINRSIGSGPVDSIAWLLPLNRLIIGAQAAEWSARSSSLDDPLSPSAFNLKRPSTQGSALVAAAKIDDSGLFVQKCLTKLYRLDTSSDAANYGEYAAALNLMELCPEVGGPGIVRVVVQRQPDTRVHCVRSDGKVAVLISQPAEDVLCWVMVETDGDVEDAYVLPGTVEDTVYYVIKRTINGSTARYVEKWALESECVGAVLNKQLDSFITYSGAATTTITGLGHLEGETVHVWGGLNSDSTGKYLGSFTVSSGVINGVAAVEKAVIGLRYWAPFKSTKLAYAGDLGTALTQPKRVNNLGLIMANVHKDGLYYGSDLVSDGDGGYLTGDGYLSALPGVEGGKVIPDDYIWTDYDFAAMEFPGGFDTDARLCLLAIAPKPCTILAAVPGLKTNDKG